MGYIYISSAVFFTVYGNLVMKWQVNKAGQIPVELYGKLLFLLRMLPNFWILSCLAAGVTVFFSWMLALTKFDLSYAYPFMSLSFVFVPLLSALFFHEALTMTKVAGLSLIVVGLILGGR